MKKVIALLVFVVGLTVSANAQVTKAQVEESLKEMNATMDDVVQLYIGNVIKFYTDGSNRRADETYEKTVSIGSTNSFSLTENGLKVTFSKNGVISSLKIFPFSMITTLSISKNEKGVYIYIYLIQ
jgi:hypothetical protein